MNMHSALSPTFTRKQARQIAAIAEGEIERLNKANFTATPWVREGLSMARDIRSAALAVLDGESGDELDALLAEWSETDPRTFALLPDVPGRFPREWEGR